MQAKFSAIPQVYRAPLTETDTKILGLSLSQLVSTCEQRSAIGLLDVLEAYGKRCLLANDSTNCIADIFLDEAAASTSSAPPSSNRSLLGVPVSIKECIDIAGHDSTIGYSSRVGHPAQQSAPLIHLLQDAGALIYAKTTLPTGCLSFETSSDLFGRTTNPYNPAFSPGASTGGGGVRAGGRGRVVVGSMPGGSGPCKLS